MIDKPVEHREKIIFEGQSLTLIYVDQMQVGPGVVCDVYRFKERDDCDLGIIYVDPKCTTPAQLIKKGDRTIEGHLLGDCVLKVKTGEQTETHEFFGNQMGTVDIPKESIMQWQNTGTERAVLFEICFPPYEDLEDGTRL